jgi:hypothetical protein
MGAGPAPVRSSRKFQKSRRRAVLRTPKERSLKFTDEMMGAAGLEPAEAEAGGFTVPCNCRYATPPKKLGFSSAS